LLDSGDWVPRKEGDRERNSRQERRGRRESERDRDSRRGNPRWPSERASVISATTPSDRRRREGEGELQHGWTSDKLKRERGRKQPELNAGLSERRESIKRFC